jgi:hypothetical protein
MPQPVSGDPAASSNTFTLTPYFAFVPLCLCASVPVTRRPAPDTSGAARGAARDALPATPLYPTSVDTG